MQVRIEGIIGGIFSTERETAEGKNVIIQSKAIVPQITKRSEMAMGGLLDCDKRTKPTTPPKIEPRLNGTVFRKR